MPGADCQLLFLRQDSVWPSGLQAFATPEAASNRRTLESGVMGSTLDCLIPGRFCNDMMEMTAEPQNCKQALGLPMKRWFSCNAEGSAQLVKIDIEIRAL